ncbi:MAG TPA: radical SAM protein, partial [bacterium]
FPYRIHAPETVLEAVKKYNPGAEKIGLEGAGLSDYPQLIPLCRSILNAGLAVSFSSIRADRITEDFIDIIRAGRIRSFTIAPEAGSERLRSRIGKAMSHDALLEKAALLSDSGIEILKLYYLIGIPGETDQDVEALIQSVRSIGDRFLGRSKTRRVRISVNAFVPKPFTEFQWAAMMPEREILSRRKRIQDGIESEKRMVFIRKSGREETLQGLLSLGDERTGLALLDAVQNRRGIPAAFADAGVDKATLVYREKRIDEPLPWDFIEYEVPKERLWNRYRKEEHGTGCNRDGRGEADRGRHRQSPG